MPERDTSSPATDASVQLLTTLVRCGLRHIVLSPGSRSQGLALVAAELERVGAVQLHVRIDERVGGFLALGIAAETGHPAAVITTSGSAPSHLMPAVLEAHHSNLPMLLLTADRPVELRGIRSNQTTVQPGLYGPAARLSLDVPAPVGDAGEADVYAGLAVRAWAAALGCAPGAAAAPPPGEAEAGAEAAREPRSDETAAGQRVRTPGPVHLNLAFREPLSTAVPDLADAASGPDPTGRHADVEAQIAQFAPPPSRSPLLPSDYRSLPVEAIASIRPRLEVEAGAGTVVIAGNAAGAEAEALAHAGGWPLLAEVSSGAHFGPNLVVAYRELLRQPEFGGAVRRAIVFGHPTLSREVPDLLRRPDVEVIVVAPVGDEVYDPSRDATAVASVAVRAGGIGDRDRSWAGRWAMASRALLAEQSQASADADDVAPDVEAARSHDPADRLAFAKAELAAVRAPVTRRMLVDAVWRFTWPHDRLVLGASRLIRDLDAVAPGKRVPVHANRGLAGIDGTIATAIGIALASQAAVTAEGSASAAAGTTRVLLGDVTLLHDAGALLFGEGEPRPAVQVIVGNDGGGTIFDTLEVAASAPVEAMRRVLTTPQRVDLRALAAAYGWEYRAAATRGELDQALSAPPRGPSIVEVPLPR